VITGMKFNKSKCHILHLGWSNAGHKYKLGEEWLESSPAESGLGVLVGSRLNRSQQCALEASKPHPGVHQTQHNQTVPRSDHSVLVQPHPEYCVQFWAPQLKKDVKALECIQRRARELVKGLEGMSCEEQLSTLGLSGLEKSRLRDDLIALCSFLRRGSREGGAELFSLGSRHRHVGMVQSCTRGGLHWTLRSLSLPRGWSNTGTGFLGGWLMLQACQCLRGIWTMP